MDIGPITGIVDTLATPRRIEGIRALRFEIGTSARTGEDRSSSTGSGYDEATGSDGDAGYEGGQEPEDDLQVSSDPLCGTRVNFLA